MTLTVVQLVLVAIAGIALVVAAAVGTARAQKAAFHSEVRMRKVIDTAEQMFVEIDTNGLITEWNRKATELTGWKREEIIGASVLDTITPPERRHRANLLLAHIQGLSPDQTWSQRRESTILTKHGDDPLHVEAAMWSTTVNGEMRLAVLIHEITQRKKLAEERELLVKRQRMLVEELREADSVKTDFISTISHELRTPLTSIIGYLEMLTDGYGGELNTQQASMLNVVDRNSRRLLGLIEDLLTLSRIEAGRFKVDPVEVSIATLVTDTVHALIPSATDHSLELDVDVAADTGSVKGDIGQLERVLLNLVSNAIKFTPEGGRVSVMSYRFEDTVHIHISDTGIGIPIEEQQRVFSRFFRSAEAQGRAIQGTGLGLTIVKSIVERHGGSVSLQSAPGVGTTVLVELPAAADVAVNA